MNCDRREVCFFFGARVVCVGGVLGYLFGVCLYVFSSLHA